MQNENIRLGDPKAKHSYEIQIAKPYVTIKVDANNRSQAARIAAKAGYPILSVNMIG
jgi:hypothetical protein